MVVIYGTRLLGKVDHVPGLFYVATKFAHINFVPLFPTGSYLVIDDGTGQKGLSIGWSLKSTLMGWLRAGCFVTGPILLLVGLINGHPHDPSSSYWELVIAGVFLIALAILSYLPNRIGRDRAVTVAERAGLDPTFVHNHFDQLEGKPPSESTPSRDIHDPRLDEALQRWNQ
jgi:hypothetical protein